MILFLDIDGVLNRFDKRGDDPREWPDERVHKLWPGGDRWEVILSEQMGQAIKDLNVDIVWTTTWQDSAYLVGDIIGIRAPYLVLDKYTNWKRGAVQRYLAADPGPWLWFEDDPGWYGMQNDRGFTHWPPGFIVNPEPRYGLLPDHLEQAKEWIDNVN